MEASTTTPKPRAVQASLPPPPLLPPPSPSPARPCQTSLFLNLPVDLIRLIIEEHLYQDEAILLSLTCKDLYAMGYTKSQIISCADRVHTNPTRLGDRRRTSFWHTMEIVARVLDKHHTSDRFYFRDGLLRPLPVPPPLAERDDLLPFKSRHRIIAGLENYWHRADLLGPMGRYVVEFGHVRTAMVGWRRQREREQACESAEVHQVLDAAGAAGDSKDNNNNNDDDPMAVFTTSGPSPLGRKSQTGVTERDFQGWTEERFARVHVDGPLNPYRGSCPLLYLHSTLTYDTGLQPGTITPGPLKSTWPKNFVVGLKYSVCSHWRVLDLEDLAKLVAKMWKGGSDEVRKILPSTWEELPPSESSDSSVGCDSSFRTIGCYDCTTPPVVVLRYWDWPRRVSLTVTSIQLLGPGRWC